MADEDPIPNEPETPAVGMTPSGYQRGSEGGLRWQPPSVEHLQMLLPQYEILGLLGHGGMGAVYKARQINLDRPVAIKILPPEAAENDPQFIERFKNEARTMARMNHPAIVHVYDYGETAEQQLYFVMEFVDGMDVQQMMAGSGTLPPDHALAITAHVCDALQYAHSQGVVHRDIKPGNVLLNREGRVKVADFGLAKISAADPSTAGLTRSTVVMGTPDYIAPEALALGVVADHRADLYAVGVMLYRMLTGTIPRGAFSLPSVKQPGVDARFDSIVLKAMQPERDERYQSAQEIRRDLDQILSTPIVRSDRTVQAAVPPQAMADRARFQARLEDRRRAEAQARSGSSPWLVPTLLIGLVLLGIGGWSLFKPEAHLPQASAMKEDVPAVAETDKKTTGAPSLPVTPDWVDALALVDVKKHAIRGSVWRRTAEGIEWVSNVQDKMYAGVFELPVPLGPSYAVEVEFTGGAADDSIGIVIPVGDGNMTTCWFGADRTSAGIGKVDGKDPWQPGPPEVSSKFSLKQNQRYTAHVEVRRSATEVDIQFLVDGKTLGTYHGPADRLTLSHHWHVDVGRTLIMLGCNRPTVFHRARVKDLAATAAPLTPTAAAFTNSLGMKFVPVPGTQALFCIHSTRVKDYAAYAAAVPGVNDQWKMQQHYGVPVSAGDDFPVVGASWDDANDFCAWLSRKEGRSYRLPTDREWSFAVGIGHLEGKDITPETLRGKVQNEYPWGSQWPPPPGAGNYADISAKEKFPTWDIIEGYRDGYPTTAPVMSFQPNKLGLYDMGGNVWQWCQDWFNAGNKERVLRGASWHVSGENYTLSSARFHAPPQNRYYEFGFRCAVNVPGEGAANAPATGGETAKNIEADKNVRAAPGATAAFTNSLGMKFVPVPVIGGATNGQRVLFSIWQTRVQDYEVFARELNHEWPKEDYEQGPTHPAVKVSWDDAQAFCVWLTKRERQAGRLGVKESYRLPSDHEWSCAVGIGGQEDAAKTPAEKSGRINGIFPWGAQWPPPPGAGNYAGEELQPALKAGKFGAITNLLAGYNDGFVNTAPVGSFAANQFGLFDLGSNVREWCEDLYEPGSNFRVQRGGSWARADRGGLLSSNRRNGAPDYRSDGDRGFRCVLASGQDETSSSTKPPSGADFTNSLGMKFVPVPETQVLFCIHATRVKDYASYATETPGLNSAWKKQRQQATPISAGSEYPVVAVTWDDASAFCAWLSKKEGRSYRLPTDREWSFAVGIGTEENAIKDATPESLNWKLPNVFPWGTEWPPPKGAGNYADTSCKEKFPAQGTIPGYTDGFPTTAPVMSFKPNRFGLYDMGGNVCEWCEDWYNAAKKERVLRNACWADYTPNLLQSSTRTHYRPDFRYHSYGFRCVVELAAPKGSAQPSATAAPPPTPPPPVPATVPVPNPAFTNTLGMKFVPVPETQVLFCIHPTRVKDYAAYAAETPGVDGSWKKMQRDGALISVADEYPVVGVNWDDAHAFCAWLTKRDGRICRLPTDREWSCAVGIGPDESGTREGMPESLSDKIPDVFPWGTEWPPPQGAGNFADLSCRQKFPRHNFIFGYMDDFPTTSPVMSFKPNKLGLHDMTGNVWQWCGSWWNTAHKERVLRGSSWADLARGSLLSSHRNHYFPSSRNDAYGFRCVMEAAPK